jgi:gliding motility-associated-like protein
MKKFLLFIFALIYYHCWGQGNIITINSTLPAQMNICGAAQTFTISIYNPSPFQVIKDTLKVTLPPGIVYQAGSVSGTGVTEFNISIPNKPVFLLPPIQSLATATVITFTAVANCDLIAYTSGGGIVENKIRVDYTANNIQNYDSYTTATYIVKQPILVIANVTNQSYSGSVGDTYTRCITITNSGLGDLSQFVFTDVHGAGIHVNSINAGTWVNSGNTETVTFNASNFTSIGNNNGLFEQGESIVMCETIHVISCSGVASNFTAGWGCNSQVCQSSTLGANVIFPNLIPNLEITPMSPPMSACLGSGNPSLQKLVVKNTGLGQALNIHLDIFQTNNGSGYNNNTGSNIDVSSFMIKTSSSAAAAITPDSTKSTNQLNCMAANAKGRAFLSIASLNSGDSVIITWNTYSCCYNACTSTGQSYFNGWAYQGNYSNVCQGSYLIAPTWGRVYSQLFATLENNFSPSTLDSGDVGAFNFKFTTYLLQAPYPGDASGYWKFIYTIPPCLSNTGTPSIVSSTGVTWSSSSATTSGNVITVVYNGAPPFDLSSALVKINLAVNCNGCSGGAAAVDIQAVYVPSTSCSCNVVVSCTDAPVTILCSSGTNIIVPPLPPVSSCPEGMIFRYYTFKRTSYGLPDNEIGGGNGLPDGSGSLNFSKIKTNRAMFGDTITENYYGRIRTSSAHPFWQYCYANSSMIHGTLLGFLDAKLVVYRGGSVVAMCTNLNPVVSTVDTTRSFFYDLSVAGLISAGCMPGGFTYADGDSLILTNQYKVAVNTTGPILDCQTNPVFYASDSINPFLGIHKFQCDFFNSSCFVIGYRFETNDNSYYTVKSCESATISQKYFLSIGPCCNNYDGGNLFPYEYRNWAHINTLTAVVPAGYTFISAQFIENRTGGSGVSVPDAAIPLTPLNPDSTVLTFPVEHYFQGYGGTLPLSDDGFSGTLDVTITPSCKVTPVVSQGIRYDWTFSPTGYLTGFGSYPTFISATQDYIIYDAPSVFLQSTLPSVTAVDSTVSWDISLSNLSNTSDAEHTWISAPTISGVSLFKLFDVDNNVFVPATGSIYEIGTVSATAVRQFRVIGKYTSCLQDSIVVYSGWNCTDGYPLNVASYPCTPQKITLKEIALIPAIDMIVTGSSTSVQLCDTTKYIVNGFNFQSGTLYNVLQTVVLPAGVVIVPGSSAMSYPLNSPYTAIPDPVLINGNNWRWNVSAINNRIDTSGLKGFQDSTLNSFKISFKVVTNCDFTAGSSIRFNLKGNAACGLPVNRDIIPADQLSITGATSPYTTGISMSTSYISPCAASSVMHVAAINHGPAAVGATDSIAIIVPNGVSYQAGSFSGIHNAPPNSTPVQYTSNGESVFKWKLPPGVQLGDSVVFNFGYAGLPTDISCGISYFRANTLNVANVLCTSTGSACNINVITGTDTLAVFSYKGYLSLSNPNGYTVPSPPTAENATIGFTINNTGQDVFAVNNTIISYYFDSNGNGVYNTGDPFIANDTLNALIPANGNYLYSSNILIPAGEACSVIAVLDTTINHCSCVPTQLAITLPMKKVAIDTNVCSAQPIKLGFPPITGYTYLWTPSMGLDSIHSSSPTFDSVNTSNSFITSTFYVTVNRGACTSVDTVKVITYPNPVLSVTGTDTICFGLHNGMAMVAVTANGTPPYSYLWNTTPPQTNDTATGLSVGTDSVTVTDRYGCVSVQTITLVQPSSPLTGAVTSQTNLICSTICNGSAAITASGGTPGYGFSWNTTPAQTTASVSGLCANAYSVTITDAIGCIANVPVTITSSPALIVSASVTSGNCSQTNNATAVVTASGGAGGYGYLWSNGQTGTTATGLSHGTYTITVTDNNSCTQTGTVVVAPAVQVTATAFTTNLCEGQSDLINAVTTGGTPGFSFLWSTAAITQNITVSPTIATTYTVTVTDANGCKDSSTVLISVRPIPTVNFISDTLGCSPLCLTFNDSSKISVGGIQQWLWDFGDGATSLFQNPTHCFINNTIYSPITETVSLTVTSTEGCSATKIKNNYITVNPAPLAKLDYSPKPVTVLTPVISFDNESLGANSFQWSFKDGLLDSISLEQHPTYTHADTGQFEVTLIVNNSYGCPDTVKETIVIGPDWALYIPNALTPTDDGINDFFEVKGYGIIKYQIFIFDRWGNLIYEADDINKPWDGKANHGTETAQQDVYVYVIKATDFKNDRHNFRGIVTLVK